MSSTAAHRLTTNELRKRLSTFAQRWQGASSERADEKLFTADFLACFDLQAHQYQREFAVTRQDGSTGYMDGFIPGKVIIEGKSLGKDLKKARQQAEDYRWACPPHQRPRFVLLHDFGRFALFDLTHDRQHACTLAELPQHAEWFRFLVDDAAPVITEETEADRRAAEQMARLHDALLRSNFSGRDLEIFLIRLLFCLFADDTAIFGDNGQFLRVIEATREDGKDLGAHLAELFDVLNTVPAQRSRLLDEDLAAFAYVNGQLFAERIRIPAFDSDLRALLLDCVRLDWSGISPAIFGAMFQSVLEQHQPDQSRTASRRELGAHYTSERNILRAINPLFMDGLRAELAAAGSSRAKLVALYDKLPTLKIFDPACGCGNFLVIAYRELRRLEMELIARLFTKGGQSKGLLDVSTQSRVHVGQCYGIEIDASAAHIAQVALWITDHQMNLEAASRFGTTRPSVPLLHSPNVRQGNALHIDWAEVLAPQECSFIVGNPPFVGAKFQTAEQRADAARVLAGIANHGLLDYVACWHVLAARYLQANLQAACALVSTNSICQGEQVGVLWPYVLAQGMHLRFAHRTFQWSNEGRGVAAVHCIIIGFGPQAAAQPVVFDYSADIRAAEATPQPVARINPYLVDGPDVVLERRSKPLCAVPPMLSGNKPIDDGNYLFTPQEKADFLQQEPGAAPYFRRWLGGQEFVNGIERWCLWLGDISAAELHQLPLSQARVAAVKKFRTHSKSAPTQKLAATPRRFHTEFVAKGSYIALPQVSSERRQFIPIAYLDAQVMCGDKLRLLEGATPYHFGILTSTMHMAWMRAVAGRLESRYQYSIHIVYNNFPWPENPADKRIQAIEAATQAVLDARQVEMQRDARTTLAMLYHPDTMPVELAKAHAALDKAVDAAYGYQGGKDDASRVAYLFGLYQQLTAPLAPAPVPTPTARRKRAPGAANS